MATGKAMAKAEARMAAQQMQQQHRPVEVTVRSATPICNAPSHAHHCSVVWTWSALDLDLDPCIWGFKGSGFIHSRRHYITMHIDT